MTTWWQCKTMDSGLLFKTDLTKITILRMKYQLLIGTFQRKYQLFAGAFQVVVWWTGQADQRGYVSRRCRSWRRVNCVVHVVHLLFSSLKHWCLYLFSCSFLVPSHWSVGGLQKRTKESFFLWIQFWSCLPVYILLDEKKGSEKC